MNSGSIMFWFMPCRMKVPGMYGFQMSGAGMLTFEGITRISLRATVPPASADAGAAVASVAAGADAGSDALVGAPAGGWLLQAASSIIRSSVPNHRLRILVFLSAKKLWVVWRLVILQEASLALRELLWEINTFRCGY
jgi:hypothetical protein